MKRTILCLAVLVAIIAGAGDSAAKSFRIERFHSDVRVSTDGSIRVTESITYRFDGRFTYAYRTIPLRDGESLSALSVDEPGSASYAQATTETPGTFYVARTGAGMRVRWYYRAEDETRTFRFSYTLGGMIHRYPDIAEYYNQIIGDADNPTMSSVSATIHLPDEGWSPSDLRAWAHGPLNGTVEIVSGSEVTANVSPLPAGRFFEVRVLMPADAFAAVPLSGGGPKLAAILDQEAKWAAEANRRREQAMAAQERYRERRALERERARRWIPVAWLLCGISVFVWITLFRRHGAPHSVVVHAAPGAAPSQHPPALVAYLMGRGVTGPALVATLVDLADRGYLTVREETLRKRGFFGREKTTTDFEFRSTGENPGVLEPFEASLLDFLFNQVGDGASFTMSGVTNSAKKDRNGFRKWFISWMKEVKEAGQREQLFEPYPVKPMLTNGVCALAVGATGAAMSILSNSAAGAPAIVAGVLQLLLTVLLHRRTPAGQRLYKEWQAFRGYLRNASRGRGDLSLVAGEWSRYVAIAIVFGLHKSLLPLLTVEGNEHGAYVPIWYAAIGGREGAGIAGLTESFTGMVDAVSTTMSSASGAGGGASAGGGGGSGGGGVGAG